MSVLHALYNTYTNYEDKAGEVIAKPLKDGTMRTYMLLPFAHTTQTAHIEIYVTEQGEYHSARIVHREVIAVPCTEDSACRTSTSVFPHALHDKLLYVAGDYAKYVNEPEKVKYFLKYKEQLENWVQSPHTHCDIQAIYSYVSRGTIIRDLVKDNILHINSAGELLRKWVGRNDKPEIFQALGSSKVQSEAVVRFCVRKASKKEVLPWENKELFEKYKNYYTNSIHQKDLCYVTGKEAVISRKHPYKILAAGDMKKLFSANDHSGFTYRGRFKTTKTSSENAEMSYEASQKIHNALKWLIERQGITIDGRVYVVWSEQQVNVPHFLEEPMSNSLEGIFSLLDEGEVAESIEEVNSTKKHTNKVLARKVAKLMQGMRASTAEHIENEHVHIISLDAATPGRFTILSYRNFQTEQYFEQLAMYQVNASWVQTIELEDKTKRKYMQAPTLYQIAQIAYGSRTKERLVKQTVERLIPVILEHRPMPFDVVQKLLIRASNPNSFEKVDEFMQGVEVACGVMKYYFVKEGYTVKLQEQNTNRSYLFGRLLAVSEAIEREAQTKLEDRRTTNALRYMSVFQMNPQRTWVTIHNSLIPYLQKLGGSYVKYEKLIRSIMALFDDKDYMSDKQLDGQYLMGYYSQLDAIYTKKAEVEANVDDGATEKN